MTFRQLFVGRRSHFVVKFGLVRTCRSYYCIENSSTLPTKAISAIKRARHPQRHLLILLSQSMLGDRFETWLSIFRSNFRLKTSINFIIQQLENTLTTCYPLFISLFYMYIIISSFLEDEWTPNQHEVFGYLFFDEVTTFLNFQLKY